MMHKVVIVILDSKIVSEQAVDRLIKRFLHKGYGGIIYSPEKLKIKTPGFLQKKIVISELNKEWAVEELSQKSYELLFLTHASKTNLSLKKLELVFYRKRKIRFVNFAGDYYSPKDLRNIIIQNLNILLYKNETLEDSRHSKWDSLWVRGIMFFLIRGIRVIMLFRGILFYLFSIVKLFRFVRANNLKL